MDVHNDKCSFVDDAQKVTDQVVIKRDIDQMECFKRDQEHKDVKHVRCYLKRFGYLSSYSTCDKGTLDNTTSIALQRFQTNVGVESSGEFDYATLQEMQKSRCGLPDVLEELGFRTTGPWKHRKLKYTFGRLSDQIDDEKARTAVENAFGTWSAAGVGLKFTRVNANESPDIFVEWRPAADFDHSMIGSVLAHADFPPGFSVIVRRPPLPLHFDDDEHKWVDAPANNKYDIETVALHEIGHCLGLLHSNVRGSVMFPSVSHSISNRKLTPDDLAGILSLYGTDPSAFSVQVAQGAPGRGIGGFDLKSPDDRAFAFDYDHTGRLDHLCLYRPGTGTLWILKHKDHSFRAVYREGIPGRGQGVGRYDLLSPKDQAFAFDYDHNKSMDHICFYRPGTGTFWIIENNNGLFKPVYQEGDPGHGIGGYDLKSPNDRAFAFDYNSNGQLDHICLYRPGTGTFWILENDDGFFRPVYQQGDPGDGIGGYDLKSHDDRAFGFDFDHSGKLDHICLYRPGTGTFWILRNSNGRFIPVYRQGDPGTGIGGYDLRSRLDKVFAYDYAGTGKSDHLVLYRPGTGTIWILEHGKNDIRNFSAVYRQGDPGQGIGGYDLMSRADEAIAFDFMSVKKQDHLVFIRPGTGTIWIMKRR